MYETIILTLVIVGLILLLFVIFMQVYKINLRNKIKTDAFGLLNTYGKVHNIKEGIYLNIGNKNYEIIFHYLNNKTDLSINSPTIWEEKHLKSVILNKSHITKSNTEKIIIVYPSKNKITRYINENEIEFIELKKTYNFYIITYNNLKPLLEKLQK